MNRKLEINKHVKDAHCDWYLDLKRYKVLFHTRVIVKNSETYHI